VQRPVAKTTSTVRLRFGELKDEGDDIEREGRLRAAFGLDGNITPLRKGQVIS